MLANFKTSFLRVSFVLCAIMLTTCANMLDPARISDLVRDIHASLCLVVLNSSKLADV